MRMILVKDAWGWKWKSFHTILAAIDKARPLTVWEIAERDRGHRTFGPENIATTTVVGCKCGWRIETENRDTAIDHAASHRLQMGEFRLHRRSF